MLGAMARLTEPFDIERLGVIVMVRLGFRVAASAGLFDQIAAPQRLQDFLARVMFFWVFFSLALIVDPLRPFPGGSVAIRANAGRYGIGIALVEGFPISAARRSIPLAICGPACALADLAAFVRAILSLTMPRLER